MSVVRGNTAAQLGSLRIACRERLRLVDEAQPEEFDEPDPLSWGELLDLRLGRKGHESRVPLSRGVASGWRGLAELLLSCRRRHQCWGQSERPTQECVTAWEATPQVSFRILLGIGRSGAKHRLGGEVVRGRVGVPCM